MPVILLTNKYSKKVLSIVRKNVPEGFDFISLDNASREELMNRVTDADYILASGRLPIDKEIIESAPRLKMVQRTGVGTDHIDLEALKIKEIPVYVNSGINSFSVAEHTILLMLSVLRHLTAVDKATRLGNWGKNDTGIECQSLKNKVVGLIGLGNIGKTVITLLQPFKVRKLYYKPVRLKKYEEKKLNIHYCKFNDLLEQVDILSLHCPLTPETNGLLGKKEFSSMKSESIIINTSRGPLIDEAALVEALRMGQIKGAGLDVFSQEPPDKKNPLFELENVILTPHVGGLTFETFDKMIKDAFENIRLFENDRSDLIENKKLQ
jgi:D-3-phosphoglycerate dehydrogenase